MKNLITVICYCLFAYFTLAIVGCGQKADETKPVSEIEAQAENMSINKLRSMALKYKDAILAKKKDLSDIADKLKEIPPAELLGDKANELKDDLKELNSSISALKERFKIYYNNIREKKGDTSDLEI